MNNPQALVSAPVFPLLVRMATPQATAFFVQSAVSIAEIWFIGRLGTAGLAGMALVFPLMMLMQMLAGGALGGAVTGAVARTMGAGDIGRAESLLWQVFIIAITLWLGFLGLYFLIGDTVLILLGGEGEVLRQALAYTAIFFPGCIMIWLYNMMLGVVRGTGNMRLPAVLMIAGSAVQVPLSGGLILGWGPLPQLGIQGAAISLLTINFINTFLCIGYLVYRSPVKLRLSAFGVRVDLLADILSVGALAAVSPFFTVSSMLIMTGLVGRFGVEALAGYGIAARVEFLVIPMVFGLGVSMNTLIGLSIGNGDFDRAERIGFIGGLSAGVITGIAGVLLALFPAFWIHFFSTEPQTVAIAKEYFVITAPFFGLMGAGLSLYFASQGAKAVGWPVTATITRFFITAVGGWILVTQFGGSVTQLFMLVSLGIVVYAGVTFLAIYFGAWRKEEGQKLNSIV